MTIGIGYWYGKKDPKFDTKFITTFAGNFGLPSIIFYSLTTTNLSIELFLKFSYYITLYVLIFSMFMQNWTRITELRSIYKRLSEFEKAIGFSHSRGPKADIARS